jgi:hypothetical protein
LAGIVAACSDVADEPPVDLTGEGGTGDDVSYSPGNPAASSSSGGGSADHAAGDVAADRGAESSAADSTVEDVTGGGVVDSTTEQVVSAADTGSNDAAKDVAETGQVMEAASEAGSGPEGGVEASTTEAGVDATMMEEGGVDASTMEEAGVDASAEGGADGAGDVGADGPAETGAEAGEDAAAEAGEDAAADAALEAAQEGGSSLVPCTTVGQTGCVECQHNQAGNGVCTPTEAALVQHDIDIHVATAPGPDPAAGCYACLNSKLALDDDMGDTGIECEDPITTGTAAECEAVLSCILHSGNGTAGSSCAGSVVNNCYCGPAAPGSACQTAGSGVNGVCASQIATGLGFPVSDNADILKNFNDQSRAAGIVTLIFQAAVTNHCPNCLN